MIGRDRSRPALASKHASRHSAFTSHGWPALRVRIRSSASGVNACPVCAVWLNAQGLTGGVLAYTCDLRFLRQGYEIEVAVPTGDGGEVLIDALAERFRNEHQRLYGFIPEAPIEMVNVRVEARGPAPRTDREPQPVVPGDGSAARTSTEQVYEQGHLVPAGVFRRERLRAGDSVAGPAIITQTDTTTFVHGGHVAVTDAWANLLISPEDAR